MDVQTEDLSIFSRVVGSSYDDEYIPLPGVDADEQVKRIKDCSHDQNNEVYWETEKGNHGWCCGHCGTTIQWG